MCMCVCARVCMSWSILLRVQQDNLLAVLGGEYLSYSHSIVEMCLTIFKILNPFVDRVGGRMKG